MRSQRRQGQRFARSAQLQRQLRRAAHQGANRDVLIQIGPVNAMATPDRAPVLALRRRRITQAREPGQRCRQLAPV
jgi:hypothetical protein